MSAIAASPRVMPMTPSASDNMPLLSASPSPATLKRKAMEDEASRASGKENDNDKRPKGEATAGIVDSQKRRLNFTQPALALDIPRRRRLEFETFLLDAEEAKEQVQDIPEQYWQLISLAGAELTSSSESLFITHLKKALDLKDLASMIAPAAWTAVIPKLFKLELYGFLATDFPSSSTGSTRIPVALQIRSWEPKEEKYLSGEQISTINARRDERRAARREVEQALKDMDDVDAHELLKGEAEDRPKEKKRIKPVVATDSPISIKADSRKSREGTAASGTSRRSASPSKKILTPEEEEAARLKAEDREAKRIVAEEKKAARDEKKAQKEREEAAKEQEKQRKQALVAKQKATMSSFFKPKALKMMNTKAAAGPSRPRSDVSDFDRVFKAVAQRPNVDWAPVNRFVFKRKGRSPSPDADDDENEVGHHLRRNKLAKRKRRAGLRTDVPFGSVGEKWSEYQNAPDPRKIADQLQNRRRFPWKTLAFDQQTRPPYCGTFTKKSVVVGPRTPFAQDPLFDYSYDSGDDWAEDEGGEDVDEPDPDAEAELDDADEDESEGEFDDWLDDSEDANFAPSVDGDEEGSAGLVARQGPQQSKLEMKQAVKKREIKKVVKLAQFVKGPCWEGRIGEGSEGLEGFRIQLLNDTPISLDPFTYVSTDTAQSFKTSFSTTVIGAQLSVRTLLSAEPVKADIATAAAVPTGTSTPGPTTAAVAGASSSGTPAAGSTSEGPKRSQLPKVLFPDSHLPELLNLIEGNTKIKGDLVSQLKAHFEGVASKAAIEVKLREVAEREGKSKDSAWRVKTESWIAAGCTPPARPVPASTTIPVNGPVQTTLSTMPAPAVPTHVPAPPPIAAASEVKDVFM